ncbi:MAG: 5,10-methylenetetrahydrofolate reductase [Acidimicrobiia bacterium]|nr:5,10-methylenetetrahydrofolate reductase [Acidimicrobiia bacterium]
MAHIRDLIAGGPTLSFEFFPPKTDEGQRSLEKAIGELDLLEPSFVSVTYGAGGSTRERTRDIVVGITATHDYPAMAHLTCIGHTRAEIEELLADYAANGVHNILALAGDPPVDGSPATGDFRYASELVQLIRSVGDFSVGVAAFPEVHPRSETNREDRAHLAAKMAQADFAITQFFFDPVPFLRLRDDLDRLGCATPLLPGIIPVLNPASVRRFADLNGARVPPRFWSRLEAATPDERVELAVEHAVELVSELVAEGVPGVHLYTLNRADASARIAGAFRLGA